MPWGGILAVGGGAAIGAWLRWGLGIMLNPVFPTLPLGTLSANLSESSELRERIRLIRQLVAMRLEFMFKPELSTLSDDERRKTLLALEAITDYECWGRMRELYGLSFDEACAVWIRVIDGLLPPTPSSG